MTNTQIQELVYQRRNNPRLESSRIDHMSAAAFFELMEVCCRSYVLTFGMPTQGRHQRTAIGNLARHMVSEAPEFGIELRSSIRNIERELCRMGVARG